MSEINDSGIVAAEERIILAQQRINELAAEEKDVFAELGKLAFSAEPKIIEPGFFNDGDTSFEEIAGKLKAFLASSDAAQAELNEAVEAKRLAEKAAAEAAAAEEARIIAAGGTKCVECGGLNEAGIRFCENCGAKLPVAEDPVSSQPGNKCLSCGYQLMPGAKFCPECGTPVQPPKKLCSACGAELNPEAKFCPECGARA